MEFIKALVLNPSRMPTAIVGGLAKMCLYLKEEPSWLLKTQLIAGLLPIMA